MKRVLFVDDERLLLEALQRMLRSHRHEWDMVFVEGGEAALAALESAPFDVIVSDMWMPGMEGTVLLENVRQRYPRVVRIILSGHTRPESAFRAVPVAHQFLLKPCDAEVVCDVIDRACSLQGILNDEAMARTVGSLGALPSEPRVYAAFTKALAEPGGSLQKVAEIVERDVALAAKCLQLVNSAFFGLFQKVGTVQSAATSLGIGVLQNLAATAGAFSVFEQDQKIEGFSIDEFQKHAQLAARISGLFALPKELADSAAVACLLHDVGTLVLASRLPEEFGKAVARACAEQQPLYRVEQELYRVSHAEVGAYLLGLWGLPAFVTEAVACHHVPARISHHGLDAALVVYLSDYLAYHTLQSSTGLWREPLNLALLEELGIADQYPAWEQAARRISAEFSSKGAAN